MQTEVGDLNSYCNTLSSDRPWAIILQQLAQASAVWVGKWIQVVKKNDYGQEKWSDSEKTIRKKNSLNVLVNQTTARNRPGPQIGESFLQGEKTRPMVDAFLTFLDKCAILESISFYKRRLL